MMSYPIIFQTKVVKINDNEIIHFNRTGCNNEDECHWLIVEEREEHNV